MEELAHHGVSRLHEEVADAMANDGKSITSETPGPAGGRVEALKDARSLDEVKIGDLDLGGAVKALLVAAVLGLAIQAVAVAV